MGRWVVQVAFLQVRGNRVRDDPLLDGAAGDVKIKGVVAVSYIEEDSTLPGCEDCRVNHPFAGDDAVWAAPKDVGDQVTGPELPELVIEGPLAVGAHAVKQWQATLVGDLDRQGKNPAWILVSTGCLAGIDGKSGNMFRMFSDGHQAGIGIDPGRVGKASGGGGFSHRGKVDCQFDIGS